MIVAILLCLSVFAMGARKAIVIGNANYQDSPLRNPVNDANLMARVLEDLGFQVRTVLDADQLAMDRGFDDFVASIDWQDEVVFYYSGHGVNAFGENYLIPTGRIIRDESEFKYYAFSCNLALEKLQKARISVMILDACRDNPFKGARSGNKGLAIMSGKAGSQYIIYSTELGKTAADGMDSNSPFTTTLAKYIGSGEKITDMMQKVTREVKAITHDRQIPWTAGNLIEDFYFGSPGTNALDAKQGQDPEPQPVQIAYVPASRPSVEETGQQAVHPSTIKTPKSSFPLRVQPNFGISAVKGNGGAAGFGLGLELIRRQNRLLFGLGFEYEIDHQEVDEVGGGGFEYFYRHIPVYATLKFESLYHKSLVLEAIAHLGLSFVDGEINPSAEFNGDLSGYDPGIYYGVGLGFAFKDKVVLQALYKMNNHQVEMDPDEGFSLSASQFNLTLGYRF